jgi:hypothetical protein
MHPVTPMLVNSVMSILTPYAKKTAEAFVNAGGGGGVSES